MDAGVVRFDTTVEIVTAENMAYRYRVAGQFRRLPAFSPRTRLIRAFLRWGRQGIMQLRNLPTVSRRPVASRERKKYYKRGSIAE
jgi:hypothetical protein